MKNCLKIIHWDRCSVEEQKKILSRPILDDLSAIKKQVKTIISDVNSLGDQALYNYTNIFDKIKLNNIKVSQQDLVKSESCIDVKVKNAIQVAINNIRTFHISQSINTLNIEINKGIYCQQIVRPIGSVGLYIPSGSAPLLSTVLMLAIPAKIAGCKKIVLCSPPPITNEVLYASKICGVQEIFQVGGAQAIAALGLGTETIPKVNKIFGPGNAYVTEAKSQISRSLYDVGIDMLAGPSEALIIADSLANVNFIASDLLSQAEHGNYSQVILITYDINLANEVLAQVHKQVKNLLRNRIIIQSLKHSKIIIVKNLLECFELSNYYAPEHLMIQCEYPQRLVKYVVNAGSIFLGSWSPVAAGDYATGANHVLPTYGSANTYSGLSLIDFQKRITVQKLDKAGFKSLASTVMLLSTIERLDAHTNSILIRLSSLMDKI